jgi:hypothetical protein
MVASNAAFDIVCAVNKISAFGGDSPKAISTGFSEMIGTATMHWIVTFQKDWKIVWSVPASHTQQWPKRVASDLQGLAKDDRHTGMTECDVAKA